MSIFAFIYKYFYNTALKNIMAKIEQRIIGHKDFLIRRPDLRLQYGNGRLIHPCATITDPDLLVGVFDNNVLPGKRFLLTSKDRQSITVQHRPEGNIYRTSEPGKSAFLYFGDPPTKLARDTIVANYLKRGSTRTDHLHLATVDWIEEAGWQTIWTPLPERKHWLHVRLVSDSTILSGVDPTMEEAQRLSEAFVKVF